MAASQQVRGMGVRQQEMVQEMLEKSKSIVLSNNQDSSVVKKSMSEKAEQQSAAVSMFNATTAPATFSNKYINWSGAIIGGSYPPAMAPMNSGSFVHKGVPYNGSSGAVVYFGTNASNAPCGWLLAWSAPTNESPNSPNRVYVECGPVANYTNIDWNFIQGKLMGAGGSNTFFDQVTRTNILATINNAGSDAILGATFGVY